MQKIEVLQMPLFKKTYKRLHSNQKLIVDDAVKKIIRDPMLGQGKIGDLAGVYVYKFNCINQQLLLAYEFDPVTRILVALGIHENFYRDLKKIK